MPREECAGAEGGGGAGVLCLVSGVAVSWQTSLRCLHIQIKTVIQTGLAWPDLAWAL